MSVQLRVPSTRTVPLQAGDPGDGELLRPAPPVARGVAGPDGDEALVGAVAAFSAGWNLAELAELVSACDDTDGPGPAAPQGLLAMVDAGPGPLEQVWLSLQLVQSALEEVRGVARVGAVEWLLGDPVASPHEQPDEVRIPALQKAVRSTPWRDERGRPLPLEPVTGQLRQALPRVHSSVLQCLYAASAGLGTAYALGVKLRVLDAALQRPAGRSRRSSTADGQTWEAVERQLGELQALVGGLKGLPQEHYAHPVCQSLGTWRAFLRALPRGDLRRPVSRGVRRDTGLAQRLHEQVQLWRRVLAGEVGGVQLLSLEAIVGIGCEGLRRLRRSTGRLLLAVAPVLAVLLALGSGVVLLAVQHAQGSAVSTTALATFVTVVAGAWKASGAARDRLVQTMDAHQGQLFGADVDRAVALAITLVEAPRRRLLRGERTRALFARLAP